MRRFLAALRFLTILPIPGTAGTSGEDLAGSRPFFPIVGLIIGAILAALAWALSLAFGPLVAGVGAVIVLAAIHGGLHLDGLSDTADGFLSSRPRQRVLEIMRDSHVGAMGVIAITLVLLLKSAAAASTGAAGVALLWRSVLVAALAGRCSLVISMALLPYARSEGGLASVFYGENSRVLAVWAAAFLTAVAWLTAGTAGLVAAACAVAVTLLFAGVCFRRIGGATGDTLGAASELVETAVLLALSAPAVQRFVAPALF